MMKKSINLNSRMFNKVSAIVVAVFLCLNVFAVIPMGASAAQSDLVFGTSAPRTYVGDTLEYSLDVRNDNGIAELDRLKANGVTATFISSDPSAVRIEAMAPTPNYPYPYRCKVTFLNIKSTIIYMTLSNGWKFQMTAPEVYNFFGDIWFTQKTASVKIGGTVQLNYDYDGDYGPKPITNPECMTYENGARWASSNTGIATVNQSGLVTGIKAGTTKITFTVPKQRVVNNTVTDYVISCDVAVSADGKATVAPTTTKKPTNTQKPGTTIKVSQSTTKPVSGSSGTTTSQSISGQVGSATTTQSTEPSAVETTNEQAVITETPGVTSTSPTTNESSIPGITRQKQQKWPFVLAVAFLTVITIGIAAAFLFKRKNIKQ